MSPSRMALFMAMVALVSGCDSDTTQTDADEAEEVQLGPYGPALGVRAPVVRSVEARTTGEVMGAFAGASTSRAAGATVWAKSRNSGGSESGSSRTLRRKLSSDDGCREATTNVLASVAGGPGSSMAYTVGKTSFSVAVSAWTRS